jgi:signal transduction histidine kinase/DNA-binding response OmpR family regulator
MLARGRMANSERLDMAATAHSGKQMRTEMGSVDILIADDHELFRRTVRSLLESQPNYRVCGEAGDGVEAVEKVRQLRPHIVLMDINMPRMDGLEATRIIRREIPDCNVIIVTQNHPTIAREQARSVDSKASVTKSDLSRDLLLTIEKVFGDANPEVHTESSDEGTAPEGWVRTGGALAKLVHGFDWTTTPLGSIETWPQSLKTVVRMMLTSRFAMWMSWGPELTFLYNDAYAKMTLGKKHPWALGRPSQKVWEEIWNDIGPRIQGVLDTGEATWDEALLLFLERSGYREETYHTFSYSPLSGDEGKIAGHLCVVTEETDRVIGERRLKTLRSLATELSKTITEGDVVSSVSRSLSENDQDLPFTLTYLLSPDGRQVRLACRTGIAAGHPAAPEVIELAEKSQTWPIRDLLSGKDSVIVEDLAERFSSLPDGAWDSPPSRALLLPITSQAAGAPAGIIVAALNPYRPLDVSYAGFLNLIAGQIAASIANARAYEEEKKRAEALAEIDRAKTLFFSNVSHEFRTPLTLMMAPLEDLLAEPGTLAPHQHERLDIAHRNSLRLLKLVNTLLDFSRIEAGRFQASYAPTDLSQLTSELASAFRSAIERAGLKFIVNCPKLDEPVYVDCELWEKIVFNLLSNAFKFTFDGEIEISVRKRGAGAELVVRDTGTGIPAQEVSHLFERFYRVKNAHARTFEGSGIGLALVQELAKQHGGSARVESEMGRGSTFRVTIPLGKDHLPADRIDAERTLTSTALGADTYVEEALRWLPEIQQVQDDPSSALLVPSELPGLEGAERRSRILLADDNSDMREYVRKLLSSSCDVQDVSDGEAALGAIRECPPDLVLTDVMMPKLDGFGLLKELRSDERTATIPVIMLSARAGEESRVEGLSAGADDYLIKPFSARELLARVNSHLKMTRIRQKAAQVEHELRAGAELERSRLHDLFMQAPAAIGLLTGHQHRYTFVNFDYLKVTGRERVEDFIGKTVLEALPELEGQGILELLDGVYRTGVPFIGSALKVVLNRGANAQPEEVYFDFIYQPMRDSAGEIEGILIHGIDVTQRVIAANEIEKREQQFRKLAQTLDAEVRARTEELEQRNCEVVTQAEQVHQLSWQLLRTQDDERRRIARELHDSAGQTLAVLEMNLATIIQGAKKDAPDILETAEQAHEMLEELTKEIRTTAYLLHPPLLDENGLPAALSWYLRGFSERSGLNVAFNISEEFGRLPREMELVVFRLVQECLINIHRHSGARSANIQINRDPYRVMIEIRDQGKGIEKEKLAQIQYGAAGLGIRGMRERLRQFQGEMILDSTGSGTTVVVTIPLFSEIGSSKPDEKPLKSAV